jgi:hypothetical protein
MNKSIAAIHVAKKQLGLDDETYRAKLTVITGKASVKDMTEAQREEVIRVFRSEGFEPAAARRPDGRQKLSGRFAAKLQALWIAGWNLGIFENRDDAALEKFVKRQTGLDAVRFCRDPQDARKAIEALKAILAREGVDWSVINLMPPYAQFDGYRIARAQWNKLAGRSQDFWPFVTELVGSQPLARDLANKDWIKVMNKFGEQIRAAKKAGV